MREKSINSVWFISVTRWERRGKWMEGIDDDDGEEEEEDDDEEEEEEDKDVVSVSRSSYGDLSSWSSWASFAISLSINREEEEEDE